MKRFALVLVVVLGASQAAAQDVSTLNPIAHTYTVLGFTMDAPKGDGWRETGSGPDYLQLVYAEQLSADTINTRLAFEAHGFPIPDPSKAPEPLALAQMSMSQRIKEIQDSAPKPQDGETPATDTGLALVAMSKVEPVDAGVPLYEYTLVVKLDGKDRFVNYFVGLAPDKTQYFAAKLETEDKDFRTQPYYAPFRAALATISFPSAAKAKPEGEGAGAASSTSESKN